MLLPDVNVLVYAFRIEHPQHGEYQVWLKRMVEGAEPYGMANPVLAGFVRIVTHPRIFDHPDPVEKALSFADQLRSQPNCVLLAPGPRHWAIFTDLCRQVGASGNLVPDAYLAALAIENGCEWITADRHYARFPGLWWRHPLE
jgi:toxin-antitoxin system PIN domain toxin